MKAIVTVKLPKKHWHNPSNKKKGKCPIHKANIYCSDVTGSHHSYIESGKDVEEIEEKAKAKHGHVTRIELIPPEILGDD